jgi:hypothetical protein
MAGKLICHITREDAKIIENLLSQLRKGAGCSVNMEIKFIITTANYIRKLRGGQGTSAVYLSAVAVVKLINEGLICQFRPAVIRSGKAVSVDVLASLSSIRKDTRKGDFMGGDLMFPAMNMSLLRTTVRVPSGTAVIVGGAASNAGKKGKDNHEFVIYLKPTIERKKK